MPAVTNHPGTQQSILDESKAKHKPQKTSASGKGKKSASQIVNETKPPPQKKDDAARDTAKHEEKQQQPARGGSRRRKAATEANTTKQEQDSADASADEDTKDADAAADTQGQQLASRNPRKRKATPITSTKPTNAKANDGSKHDEANADTANTNDNTDAQPSKTQRTTKPRGQPRAQPRATSQRKSPNSSVDLIAAQNSCDTANNTTPAASTTQNHRTITINRAPVLHLWAACVAWVTHPELRGDDVDDDGDPSGEGWQTCLSAGAAVAGLCAVSKGRALGMIGDGTADTAEDGDADVDEGGEQDEKKQKEKQRKKEKMNELHHIDVMGFSLPVKQGLVQVSGKPKPTGENNLKNKYGGEQGLEEAKNTFLEAAGTWKGDEETLQKKKAFGFYEKFRPGVDSGTAGWGRNGVLDLENVRKIASKEGMEGGQRRMEDMVGE